MILKRKFRYLLVESTIEKDFADKSSQKVFLDSLLNMLGETAYANADPKVVWQNGRLFIMKVVRGSERDIILSLSFLKRLDSSKIGFYTLKTSGTIRSLKDRYVKSHV